MFEEECLNNDNYAMHLGSVPTRGQNQYATDEECSNNYNMHREYATHLGSVPSRDQNQFATEEESSNNHDMHRGYAMNMRSTASC